MVIWAFCLFFSMFPGKWTLCFWKYLLNKHFFQNGSPGQIAMLDQSGSEFCVEPRYQSPNISHMSQIPTWKLQIQFSGQNVNLNFQVMAGDGGDGGGGGVPRTLPIWQEPWTIKPRNQISRSGIPHCDLHTHTHALTVPETFYVWKYLPNNMFFKNGSPGQLTMLDQSGSNFCVEPRYQNPESSHMSQNPIWKLQI